MHNGPIVISGDGAKIFHTHEAWHNHCAENKIKDPFKLIRDIENEYHHYKELYDENGHHRGTQIIIDDPTKEQQERLKRAKEYRENYMISREIWEGKYIFKNFGYNVLSKFAQQHQQGETAPSYDKAFHEWYKTVYPCESAEKQCAFSCPVFHNCPYREQGVYRNDTDYSVLFDE